MNIPKEISKLTLKNKAVLLRKIIFWYKLQNEPAIEQMIKQMKKTCCNYKKKTQV
jgi:hypothetical protein